MDSCRAIHRFPSPRVLSGLASGPGRLHHRSPLAAAVPHHLLPPRHAPLPLLGRSRSATAVPSFPPVVAAVGLALALSHRPVTSPPRPSHQHPLGLRPVSRPRSLTARNVGEHEQKQKADANAQGARVRRSTIPNPGSIEPPLALRSPPAASLRAKARPCSAQRTRTDSPAFRPAPLGSTLWLRVRRRGSHAATVSLVPPVQKLPRRSRTTRAPPKQNRRETAQLSRR